MGLNLNGIPAVHNISYSVAEERRHNNKLNKKGKQNYQHPRQISCSGLLLNQLTITEKFSDDSSFYMYDGRTNIYDSDGKFERKKSDILCKFWPHDSKVEQC